MDNLTRLTITCNTNEYKALNNTATFLSTPSTAKMDDELEDVVLLPLSVLVGIISRR